MAKKCGELDDDAVEKLVERLGAMEKDKEPEQRSVKQLASHIALGASLPDEQTDEEDEEEDEEDGETNKQETQLPVAEFAIRRRVSPLIDTSVRILECNEDEL
jgi:cobalamin biosynthesis protein CobT